ncbi:MAG: fibronectin type III domain-containing protein [Dehalococcoidia bacterium]|jgi:hypothetical protein|nr:fibronectin type III domain-containing protein [Dehalococcoidia bacterium]
MGERFTYIVLATLCVLAIACSSGDQEVASETVAVPEAVAIPGAGSVVLPGPPEIVRVTPGDGYATIDWTAPVPGSTPGNAVVDRYVVTGIPDGSRSIPGDVLTARVGGLSNGGEYVFTVRAANEAGFGPDSGPSKPVLVAGTPGPPPAVVSTELAEGGIRLAWLAPLRDGGSEIITYIVSSEDVETALVLEGQPSTGYMLVGDLGDPVVQRLATGPPVGVEGRIAYSITLPEQPHGSRYRISAGNALGDSRVSGWSNLHEIDPELEMLAGESASIFSGLVKDEVVSVAAETEVPARLSTPTPVPYLPVFAVSVEATATPAPTVTRTPTPTPETTPAAALPTATPAPLLIATPEPDVISVFWRESLFGVAGSVFHLHSFDARSTFIYDVLRVDIDWGDGTTEQGWFEHPTLISSKTIMGSGDIFGYHTYEKGGVYPVTVTVTAVNRDFLKGETTLGVIING